MIRHMSDDELDPTSPISEFEDDYSGSFRMPPRTENLSSDFLDEPIGSLMLQPPVCVDGAEKVTKVLLGMAARNHGSVLIVEDGRLAGIFSERDFVRRVFGRLDPDVTPIGEVMTRDPEALRLEHSIAFVLNKMTVGGFRHVPIIDSDARPVGVVSVKDIVRLVAARFPSHVLPVPPDPTVFGAGQDGG